MRQGWRPWLIAFACCVIALPISIQYVDRPVANFLEMHFRHTETWAVLDRVQEPFKLIPVAALFFLFGVGAWLLSGRPLRDWMEKPLVCSWALIWSLAAEYVLKRIFGRGWPEPTYIRDHLYGF